MLNGPEGALGAAADEDQAVEALRWAMGQIERQLAPITGPADPVAGTAPGWRIRTQLAGIGPVFAKIADGTAWSARAVGGEAALLDRVRHRHMPRLIASDPAASVPWMVLPDLSDADWPPPWPADVAPVMQAVRRLGRATPPPWLAQVGDVDPWAGLVPGPVQADDSDDRDLLAGADRHDEPWWLASARPLSQRSRAVSLVGSDLVHGDLGAGNVCLLGSGRPIIIDWSDAYIGNGEIDLVTVAVDRAHTDGIRELPDVADPVGWLATIAGLLIASARRPPWPGNGGDHVRAEQAALARTAVDWALAALAAE